MKQLLFSLALSSVGILSAVQSHACNGEPGSVERVVCLADSLKATLTTAQVATLQLSYSYTNSQAWSNLPTTFIPRIGLSLGSMNSAQQAIAKALIKEISGNVANEGYDEFEQLLQADAYLSVNGGGNSYGSGLYYLCFNGTPSATGLFSVKLGGHHLQIENTYNNGVMIGGTPHFEAVEPLSFAVGGTTYAPITQEKNALAGMFSTLSTTELAAAKLSQTFTDIVMGAKNNGSYKDWIFPATKVGLKVGNLTAAQQALVLEAIKTYVFDIDSLHADAILAQYAQELSETYIAYSGNAGLTTKNDYARIDGPGVWIEFTVQGGIVMSGVHYHSIWRDHLRDYGGAGSTNGVYTTSVGAATAMDATVSLIHFVCYPNPTNDYLTLQYTLAQATQVRICVYDTEGRLVLDTPIQSAAAGEHAEIIRLSALGSGIYHVVLVADNRRNSITIHKE